MSKIPTIKEFLDNHPNIPHYTPGVELQIAIIEFAKLHVEAALKKASENAETKWVKYTDHDYEIDKDSILNAYPPENVK